MATKEELLAQLRATVIPTQATQPAGVVLEENVIMAAPQTQQPGTIIEDDIIVRAEPGSKEDLLQQLRQTFAPQTVQQQLDELSGVVPRVTSEEQPQTPEFFDRAMRAAGLNVRALLEGGASLPLAAADLAALPINAISRAIADQNIIAPFGPALSQELTGIGLPTPETTGERLVSGTLRGAASVAGGFGAGQLLKGAEGIAAKGVGELLTAAPGVQVVSGAGAGVSAETAKEAGAGVVGQTVAGLIGGLASGVTATTAAAKFPAVPPAPTIAGQRTTPLPSGAPDSEIVAATGASKIGLDLNTLDSGLRDAIRRNADEAIAVGSDLTPDAIARKAVYESLGIQPTRALITRSFDDALREQNLLTEPEGAALRQIYSQNNQAIRTEIRTLAGDAEGLPEPVFGGEFRKKLIAGERRAQKLANNAFNKAVLAEGDLPTETQPLVNYLQDNAAILNTTNAGKPVIAQLKQLGVIDEANMIPLEPTAASPLGRKGFQAIPITLKELSTIRKTVNDAWRGAKQAGEGVAESKLNSMRKILNEAEEKAGGELFKAYRTLRGQKGRRFEDNPLIDDLISNRKGFFGTDKIEDSEVFGKAILRSTPEQFAKVWPRILPKARKLTRNQVSKYLEDTVFSNQGTNEAGDVVASAAKLTRALNQIGPEKMKLIFGKAKADRLNQLSKSLREISSPPRGTVPAGSAPKLQFLTRAILGVVNIPFKLTGTGNFVAGAKALADKGAQARQNLAEVERAIQIFPQAPGSQAGALESILAPAIPGTAAGILENRQETTVQPQQAQQ